MIKTLQGWKASKELLNEYLEDGDYVDDEFVNYFISICPPVTNNVFIIQFGEAYDLDDNGNETYLTLKRDSSNKSFHYAGLLPLQQKISKIPDAYKDLVQEWVNNTVSNMYTSYQRTVFQQCANQLHELNNLFG